MHACTYVCVYIYTPKSGQGAEAEGHRAGAVGHVRDGEELFKPIGFKEHQGTHRQICDVKAPVSALVHLLYL